MDREKKVHYLPHWGIMIKIKSKYFLKNALFLYSECIREGHRYLHDIYECYKDWLDSEEFGLSPEDREDILKEVYKLYEDIQEEVKHE